MKFSAVSRSLSNSPTRASCAASAVVVEGEEDQTAMSSALDISTELNIPWNRSFRNQSEDLKGDAFMKYINLLKIRNSLDLLLIEVRCKS